MHRVIAEARRRRRHRWRQSGVRAVRSVRIEEPPAWSVHQWLRAEYEQLISVDTWRARRGELACAAGADLIQRHLGGRRSGPAGGGRGIRRGPGVLTHRRRDPRAAVQVNYGTTTRGVVDAVVADVRAAARRNRVEGVAGRDPDRPTPISAEHLSQHWFVAAA